MSTTNPTQTVPGPEPVRGLIAQLRTYAAYDRDALGMIRQGFDAYGDVWRIEGGGINQFMFRHPDHYHTILITHAASFIKDANYKDRKKGLARFMGNGLVTSDGEFWRRQRKLIQPAFHAKRIENYAEAMVSITLDQIAGWRTGSVIDVDEAMMEATLRVVTKSVFDVDLSGKTDTIGEAMTVFQEK